MNFLVDNVGVYSTMPSDNMDDIELKNIQLQFPSARSMSRDDSTAVEETVETDRGPITVAVQGMRNKPAILTYHDLGLNCKYSTSPLNFLLVSFSDCVNPQAIE